MYSLGATKCNVAWLLVPISIGAVVKYRKARNKAKTKKLPPAAKVGDLPPWVYFPDTDRVEWVNNMVRQLWPRIQEYADKTARDMTDEGGALHGYKFYAVIQ